MIQVKIVTNTIRKTIAIQPSATIRDVLDNNQVNYSNAPVYLDGAPLQHGEHDKTFQQLGITERCILTAVVKTENA